MKKIEFEIKLDENDAVEFAKLHFYKAQKWFYIFFIVFSIIFFVIGIYMIINSNNNFKNYLLLIIGPVMYLVYYISMIRTAKNNYRNNKTAKQTMKYMINTQEISQIISGSTSLIKWEDVYKIHETKTIIAIYLTKVHSMVIPKKKIKKEQLTKLLQIISENKSN